MGCSTRGGELAKCCTYCRVIEAALRACRIEFKTIFIDLMDKHDKATQKQTHSPRLILRDLRKIVPIPIGPSAKLLLFVATQAGVVC